MANRFSLAEGWSSPRSNVFQPVIWPPLIMDPGESTPVFMAGRPTLFATGALDKELTFSPQRL